jgi:hypothetical protein
MQISVSNAIKGQRTLGVTPSLPTVVYKQGVAGELEGGIIFYNYNATWYESHPDYSFYHIDIYNTPLSQLVHYTIESVEDLFSSDTLLGRDDWKLVEEVNPNTTGFIGFPVHEYDLAQSAFDNFASVNMFDSMIEQVLSIFLAAEQSLYSKIRVLYRGYSGIGVIEADFPQDGTAINNINKPNNWTAITIPSSLLGVTLASDSASINDRTLYFAARCVSYLGPDVPPFIELPPSPLNIYDSGAETFPNGLLPNSLLAYGDVLEPARLSTTIDRYRETPQIQNVLTPVRGVASEIGLEENFTELTSQIVTTQTSNKQVILKLYIIQETKPAAPWYDKDSDEVLTAVAEFRCYKNAKTASNLLLAISAIGEQPVIESESVSVTLDTIVLNGVTYYTAIHTFYFDVSNVVIALDEDEIAALNSSEPFAAVNDLAYIGALDENVDIKMRSMIFEFEYLRFNSNKRSISRDMSSVIKTGATLVVPTIGGAIGVGQDASAYILEPTTTEVGASGALYLSMKPGEIAPERTGIDFDFAFSASATQNKSYSVPPTLNRINIVFDTQSGALTKDSEFRFVGGTDATKRFTGYVEVEFDRSTITGSPDLSFNLYLLVNNSEDILLSTPTVTVNGNIETYQFNFDYTHTFVGSSAFDILETARLSLRAIDNVDFEVISVNVTSGTTWACESVPFDSNAPTSDPQYLQTPPAPIQRFNRY